jgi:hypothetical protein
MPKQLTLQQCESDSSATQLYEPTSAPRATAANRLRDQLLAGAGLSLDKNGGICRRDTFNLFEHRSQRRTLAYDLPTPVVDDLGQAAAEFAPDGRDSSRYRLLDFKGSGPVDSGRFTCPACLRRHMLFYRAPATFLILTRHGPATLHLS